MNRIYEAVNNVFEENNIIDTYHITYYNSDGDRITYEEVKGKEEAIKQFNSLINTYKKFGSENVWSIELTDDRGELINSAEGPWDGGSTENQITEKDINPEAQMALWDLVDDHTYGDMMVDAVCKKYKIDRALADEVISNYIEYKKEQEKIFSESENRNLNEQILADGTESEIRTLIEDIKALMSTIKHTVGDEMISINARIERINEANGLLLDTIETDSIYANLSDVIKDMEYELKNSEWSKEEANEMDEAEHYIISNSFGDKVYSSINRMSPTYSKVISYLVKQGYGSANQIRELIRDSAFFTDDLSDEELHTIASIVGLKESDDNQDVDKYINMFRNVLKQKDSSSFERAYNAAMIELRKLPSEGILNADLYYAGLKAHAEEGTYGACMTILELLRDIRTSQE